MSIGYLAQGAKYGTRVYGYNGQIAPAANAVRPVAAVICHNDGAAARWLHLFASASALPANATAPDLSILLPATDNTVLVLPAAFPLSAVGWWAISSTGNTLTVDVAATAAFQVVLAP